MASVLRAAVGRLAATLGQAARNTSRPFTPSSQPCPASTVRSKVNFSSLTSSKADASSGLLISSSSVATPKSSHSSSPLLLTTSSNTSRLLSAADKFSPLTLTQTRSYHVRSVLKKRCASCFFVRRKGRMFVECKAKPRHKQMQVMSKRKTWKEDYSKGNIGRAIYWKYDGDVRYYKLGDNEFARHDWLKGKIGVTV